MSDPNKNNPEMEPTLGDILQLQATIESLPEVGLRDLSETERIAVNRYPQGMPHTEGTAISHIALMQRVRDSGRYATAMNYTVLRDGADETTTRLIKRPPFRVDMDIDPTDVQAVEREAGRMSVASTQYEEARDMGMYDLTAIEVRDLTQGIKRAYSSTE